MVLCLYFEPGFGRGSFDMLKTLGIVNDRHRLSGARIDLDEDTGIYYFDGKRLPAGSGQKITGFLVDPAEYHSHVDLSKILAPAEETHPRRANRPRERAAASIRIVPVSLLAICIWSVYGVVAYMAGQVAGGAAPFIF